MRARVFLLSLTLALAADAADYFRRLPAISTVYEGYREPDSVAARLRALPRCPAEGLWQMANGDGALFAIERENGEPTLAPTRLRMVMVRSPRRSILPGTLLGHLVATPQPGVYEARLYSGLAQRSGLNMARPFTLVIDPMHPDLLTFKPFRSPVKVNLFKLLPHMYRRGFTIQDSRPEGLDGAMRVSSGADSVPLSPVYL